MLVIIVIGILIFFSPLVFELKLLYFLILMSCGLLISQSHEKYSIKNILIENDYDLESFFVGATLITNN